MVEQERIELDLRNPPELDWDSSTIGLVLSMFYYGGLFSFLGGNMVSKYGGATTCALNLMASGIAVLLHPISLNYSFPLFLVIRFLTGIFDVFVIISIFDVCSKWIPKNERSKLMSFVATGNGVGSALVHGVSGYLAYTWCWAMVFYVTGTTSVALSLLCFVLVKNEPSEDKLISKAELTYFQQQLENPARVSKRKVEYPYRNILTSAPIWALLAVKFTHAWLTTIINTFLPLFLKDVTGDDTSKIGIFSSIPNVASVLTMPICGIFLNYTGKFNISVTMMHKMLICGSFIFGAFLFSGMTIVFNFTASIISFSFTMVSLSIVSLVTNIIIISIFPNSAGIVAGTNVFVCAIGGIVSRSATGYMTTNRNLQEWNNCFILSSICFVLSAVVFGLYGSSEPQPSSKTSISDISEDNLIQKNQNRK